MKTITDLPSELIAHVTTYLDDDQDVFAARLSSKAIESAGFSEFGHRFFRKKGYMLTTPSLNTLGAVAQHEGLRKHVQHVWFNPDCYTFVQPDCTPYDRDMSGLEDPKSLLELLSPGDRKKYEAYKEVMKDHSRLLEKSARKLQSILARAFASLPNLKIIGMRRSEDHAPWGWRQLMEAVGQDPRVLGPTPSGPRYSLSEPTRLFMAIVHAVAASDTTLRRFYTDAVEIDNIRPDHFSQETLDKACGSIWYLEINATRGWLNERKEADYIQVLDKTYYGEGLVRLLKAATQLKEIGLQIFPGRTSMSASSYHDSACGRDSYSYVCLQKIVENVQLPYLERVKLERITASPVILLGFLRSCRERLTSLKLRDVRLLTDGEHPRPWRSAFQFLHDGCPKLEYLLFYHLLHSSGGLSFVKDPRLSLHSSETDTTTGASNPLWNSGVEEEGDEFFVKYEHLAMRVAGADAAKERLGRLVEEHWYHGPIFSYQMDDGFWHTDTSDEEW